MLGPQVYAAEKGKASVFIDPPPLCLLRHWAEDPHFALGFFELGKIHEEVAIGVVKSVLKSANMEDPRVRIQIPHAATGAAGHGQPFQVRRCGKSTEDAQPSKRQLQSGISLAVRHLIEADFPVQSFAAEHLPPNISG